MDCKQYTRVTDIYERLIATPTHGYLNNFEWYYFFNINSLKMNVINFFFLHSFKDYIKKYPKNKILETGKFLELRKEVLAEIKEADAKKSRKLDSDSDSDDMTDPMEQVIYTILMIYLFLI